MKKLILLLFFALVGLVYADAETLTAQQILQKSASSLLNSGGITAKYTFKSGNYSESGSIKVKGKKYCILSDGRNVWYNGQSLWTLDHSEKEVTLSAPTASEAAALNPYMLVSNYKSDYTASLVKGKISGTYNIQLIPKNRQSYIKMATICIKSSNYMPVRVDITDRSGVKSVIIVTDVKTGVKIQDSIFTYSSAQYPGFKLIDLR